MDIKAIEKVIKRVESSHVHQVTICDGNQSITVTNRLSNTKKQPHTKDKAHTKNQAQISQSSETHKTSDKAAGILSPYVGYIQLSPDAGSEALVKKGDSIEIGQTVAYVDVLSKLLPVLSEQTGVVDAVLVTSGDCVEYGQPIIKVTST